MTRRVLVACVLAGWAVGAARADDTRAARLGPPAPVSPYAPASAYPPANAFDPAVKPAGGVPPSFAPVVPAGGLIRQPPQPAILPASVQPAAVGAVPVYPDATGGVAGDPIARLNCDACGPDERGWVRADYLLWAVKSGGTQPLAVRDMSGTARTAVGIPGTLGQRVLVGGAGMNGDLRSGFRVSGGWWLDGARQWGVSGDFFFLAVGNDGGQFASPGDPPLSRPFFNAATGRPDAELVAFPGVLAGSVVVSARNTLSGAGAFLQRNLCCEFDECANGFRLDALAGYRHVGLNDDVSVREDLLGTGAGAVAPGTRVAVTDRFRTENAFHGGLLGLTGAARRGSWSADFRGGAALGNLRRELLVEGTTTALVPGQPPSVRAGGLLAQPTNIGRYTSDAFAVVPEVGFNLGYEVTPNLRVHVGYTFLYLPNAWRAGDQIDRGIDAGQLRGAASALGRPAPVFATTGATVQGVNFGLSYRY